MQARLGVGRRYMGRIRTRLALEDHRRVAATAFRWRGAVDLLHEALHRGSGLDQGAVNGEVLIRPQSLPLGQLEHPSEERAGDRLGDQAIPVGAEGGVVPHRLVHAQPDEAAIQQVVVDLIDQLPFGADGEEKSTWIRLARSIHSGGIDSLPVLAYRASSSEFMAAKRASTTTRSVNQHRKLTTQQRPILTRVHAGSPQGLDWSCRVYA